MYLHPTYPQSVNNYSNKYMYQSFILWATFVDNAVNSVDKRVTFSKMR